ncbi:MAG: MerR family transcriptional regulator [Candidatus Firestonebacteria bacterium]
MNENKTVSTAPMAEIIIPDKLFFTISEVSEITMVKPYILRYWEKQFKILKPVRSIGGQRSYRKKDVEMVVLIKKLLYAEKFTIAGAKNRLNELKEAKKTHPQMEINFREAELLDTVNKLKKKLQSLKDSINS